MNTPLTALNPEEIRPWLATNHIGQQLDYQPRIDSTNTYLRQRAEAGAPEGIVALTDEQLAGRGRFQRRWHAPFGSSILASILFRPTWLPAAHLNQLTMICALAMQAAIESETGLSISLKWPNDLVYQHKKLAGILTEAAFEADQVAWVIVGLGLNVGVDFANLTLTEGDVYGAWLQANAISLQTIVGQVVSREALIVTYVRGVDERYERLRRGESPVEAWRRNLLTLGRSVTVTSGDHLFTGVAEDVLPTGALMVRKENGQVATVAAGDVSLRH